MCRKIRCDEKSYKVFWFLGVITAGNLLVARSSCGGWMDGSLPKVRAQAAVTEWKKRSRCHRRRRPGRRWQPGSGVRCVRTAECTVRQWHGKQATCSRACIASFSGNAITKLHETTSEILSMLFSAYSNVDRPYSDSLVRESLGGHEHECPQSTYATAPWDKN